MLIYSRTQQKDRISAKIFHVSAQFLQSKVLWIKVIVAYLIHLKALKQILLSYQRLKKYIILVDLMIILLSQQSYVLLILVNKHFSKNNRRTIWT
jgi:hypothetical protein